ncbi:hypothetical protein [Streptomyces sp. NRRL F-2664]|nr:hypothetical protein [Streptomyces sp. NRRL F-2664]
MCRQSATVCLIESPSRQHRALPSLVDRLPVLPVHVGGAGCVTRSWR